jgi:ribosomal protein S18 acetylase RimI-like enzyme
METIKSLDTISFESLFCSFNKAFGDYEIQINREELRVMLSRRGFNPSLSFGFFENNELIAFTLNGIGDFDGKKTAYDTGTGTLKEYRGKGLASKVFTASIPFLREAGVSQYLLEVLQNNITAISVYKKLGFEVSREFNYFTQPVSLVNVPLKKLPSTYHIDKPSLDKRNEFLSFCDFTPSWQNSFDSILRRADDFIILGAYDGLKLVGFCVFEPISGDITQIAVDEEHRRQGIASVLLSEVIKYCKHSQVKALNTETTCENLTAFLNSFNIIIKGKQFEMIKYL